MATDGVIHYIGKSDSDKINVYTQLTEPSEKDGVWIKTEETIKNIDNYIIKQVNTYNKSGTILSSISSPEAYKGLYYELMWYDINNDSMKAMSSAMSSFATFIVSVAIGTNIYYFGNNVAYKYDRTTTLWTQLANTPFLPIEKLIAVVGNDIYLFTKDEINNQILGHKYNILTNEFTKIIQLTSTVFNSDITYNGTDIYMIGGYTNQTYWNLIWKYDTLTNTKTDIATLPSMRGSGAAVFYDNKIYIIGGRSSNTSQTYHNTIITYDITTNKFETILTDEKVKDISNATLVNNDIYYLSKTGNIGICKTSLKKVSPEISKYKYDKLELVDNKPYEVQLLPDYRYRSNYSYYATGNIVDNNLYIISYTSSNDTIYSIYKYNLKTNLFSFITIPTYSGYMGVHPNILAIGTDIYLFLNDNYNYKLDTLTNTFTSINSVSNIYTSQFNKCVLGTDIYFFKEPSSTATAYKYDTLTNEITLLNNIPYTYTNGSSKIVSLDTDIYIFSHVNSSPVTTQILKYNTLTNTYTQLNDLSFVVWYDLISINDKIYDLGNQKIYDKYLNIDSIPDMKVGFSGQHLFNADNTIYIINNRWTPGNTSADIYIEAIFKITVPDNNSKSICLRTTPETYQININKLLSGYISDAYINDNGEIFDYPAYYGDGTSWNLIENN